MKYLLADCETTGLNEPEVVEVAYFEFSEDITQLSRQYYKRFKPSKPIELGATATHHIFESDLQDCEPSSTFVLPTCEALIGHNIDYDWAAFGKPDVKRICTLALARHLLPELPTHTQIALAYHFFGTAIRETIRNAHNALEDIKICAMILPELIKLWNIKYADKQITCMSELYAASEIARVPLKLTFGKHRGKTYEQVMAEDAGYFIWWKTKSDTKPNEYELKAIEDARLAYIGRK